MRNRAAVRPHKIKIKTVDARTQPARFDPMRTQGSCRFAPYYKAQWFDEKQLAWRDVQKQFATPDEARSAFDKGKWRVMEITMTGRKPL